MAEFESPLDHGLAGPQCRRESGDLKLYQRPDIAQFNRPYLRCWPRRAAAVNGRVTHVLVPAFPAMVSACLAVIFLDGNGFAVIYYVCHPSHTYTCAVLLLWYGDRLRRFFRFVPYGVAHLLQQAGPGVVIWTDFDRLDRNELADNARLQSELKHLAHLNHPLRSELQFAMLQRLHREGVNRFAVRRAYEPLDGLRYPVFLRDELGASKQPPELLRDRASLESAIAALPSSGIASPMIVEFGSRPYGDGFYRKYGAFRVGERIYPQHCFVNRNWFIKLADGLSFGHYGEHLDYVRNNPHAGELRKIFDSSNIAYGRIDYAIVDDRIQIFEINTNPAVLGQPPKPDDKYDQAPYAREHIDALFALPNATHYAKHDRLDAASNWKLDQVHKYYGGEKSWQVP